MDMVQDESYGSNDGGSKVHHSVNESTDFTSRVLQVLGEIPQIILSSGKDADFAIDQSFARVGTLINASRVYLLLEEKDGRYLRNTHEWVNENVGPVMYSWPLYDFEFDIPSMKHLIANHDLYYCHTSAMPLDLSQVFTKQGVRTFIMSPVYRDNAKVGLVGADFCERERDDCETIAPVFRYLAGLVAMALEKKQHQLLLSKVGALRSIIHEIEPMLRGRELEEFNQAAKSTKPITLLDAERRIIIETLELYKGNKLKTAKHLGLTWPSLDRRCKKLGIEVRKKNGKA